MQEVIAKYIRYLQGALTSTQVIDNDVKKNREFNNMLALLNYGCMLFVLVNSSTIMLSSYFITLPFYYTVEYDSPDTLWKWRLFSVYLFVNAMSNYFLILYFGVSSVYCSKNDLPLYNVSSHDDWTKCEKCDRFVPPRTRHCSVCDRCILKRDHHCYFTGCCIGFYNQRFFIMFNVHGVISCLSALYFLKTYLGSHYVELFSVEFFKYILPYAVTSMLLGYTTFSIFLVVVLFYVTLITGLMCAYFVFWQANLIIGGQTSYEFIKGNKFYQSTLSNHLRSVFGNYWALNILFPMPHLKPEGDGMSWPTVTTKFL